MPYGTDIHLAFRDKLDVFYKNINSPVILNLGQQLSSNIYFKHFSSKGKILKKEDFKDVILYDKNENICYNWFLNRYGFPKYSVKHYSIWEKVYNEGLEYFLSDMNKESYAIFLKVEAIDIEFKKLKQ
jgi:hypothetical protein